MSDINDTRKEMIEKYPFMSYITYGGHTNDTEKQTFLTLGDEWWWQSNRQIPINIFIKADWKPFRNVLKTFNSKDVEIEFGPCVNLREIAIKRTKKKSITLVRKID
jgi:hypothetical protein